MNDQSLRPSLSTVRCSRLLFNCLFLTGLLCPLLSSMGQEQQPTAPAGGSATKPLRELYVPFESLDVLLGKEANRVFMTREEYDELKRKADIEPSRDVPVKHALLSADYRIAIEDGRAMVQGELQFESLVTGWQAISLPFHGVGIRSARWDDAPAALAKDESGISLLFIRDIGKHRLSLDMVMPVSVDATHQSLQFHFPAAPVGRLSLSAPGNVEIKSGAQVIRRTYDDREDKTDFEILPNSGPTSILLSLNNKTLQDKSTVIARGVLIAEITQGYQRLHATMSMGVLSGASDEFRFSIDDDLEVNTVASESLSRWTVETVDGKQELRIKLHSPTSERIVINLQLDRSMAGLADWTFPRLEPLDVAGYSSVIGVLIEPRLSASNIESESLIPINSQVLTNALPPTLLQSGSGAPALQPIAAFYAPGRDYALASNFAVEPRELNVSANSVVIVSDQGLRVTGGFALRPRHEKLFYVDFLCPDQWNIEEVKTADLRPVPFERFAPDQGTGTRIRAMLPDGVAPGNQFDLLFEAVHTPNDWLSSWTTRSVELPQFPLLQADRQVGAVAVQIQDDFDVVPDVIENALAMTSAEKQRFQLTDVDSVLAYRYEGPDWRVLLTLEKTKPQMKGQIYSFIQLSPDMLRSHTEAVINIRQARSRQLTFSLPESTPAEVTFSGLQGTVVNESSSEVVDGRRVWTVELAERQAGDVRLAIDFTQRLSTDQYASLALPIVRAENVEYQSGKIAVEGHPELEVQLPTHPRVIDMGELADAEYQVGTRLLGVYGYVGNDDAVVADLSRIPVHPLPTTIVQRAELVSLISAHGPSQTAARYLLRTKASYLEVRLPPDAELWSATVDGTPALPQREDELLLIALPVNLDKNVRDLQLVFQTPGQPLGFRGDVSTGAPKLFQRDDRLARGVEIPIADVKWEWMLPSGYRLATVHGNVTTPTTTTNAFTLPWLLDKLWELGGGVADRSFVTMSAGTVDSVAIEMSAPASQMSQALSFERDFESSPSESSVIDSVTSSPIPPPAPAEPVFDAPIAQKPTSDLFAEDELAEVAAATQSANVKTKAAWALEGVRSLAIDLDAKAVGEKVTFTSLGHDPYAQATLVDQTRLDWLAWIIGVAVFAIGALLVPKPRRAIYLLGVAAAACLLPPVTGMTAELESISTAALVATLMLALYFLVATLLNRVQRRKASNAHAVTTHSTPISAAVLLLVALAWTTNGHAQESAQADLSKSDAMPGQIVTSSEMLAQLLARLGPADPVVLPEDAVVIPYDPANRDIIDPNLNLMVPYQVYTDLWNRAHPVVKSNVADLPSAFAWEDAQYSLRLDEGDSVLMTGRLTLQQFVDRELAIPMPLAGCVLETITIDGKPARLQMIQTGDAPQGGVPGTLWKLLSQGKGKKQIELELRWNVAKQTGWRVINGELPSSPACRFTVIVPKADTVVRLDTGNDRALHETTKADEEIITSLSRDGVLSLQWRDKIAKVTGDQRLTVQATSVFDVQEDSLKLAWKGEFEFRNGQRETLTLRVPKDYLIRKVVGDNIRGWKSQIDGENQRLDIELLKAASDRESLAVFLSKDLKFTSANDTKVTVPVIAVDDAMLHQGNISLRRSTLLDLHTLSSDGLSREDATDDLAWFTTHEEPSPLPLRVFQSYRYAQVPFTLELAIETVEGNIDVEHQTIMKVSQRDASLESRLLISPIGRPVYRFEIDLPAGWELQTPEMAGSFQWSLKTEGERQRLRIYMANGQLSTFPIVLRGHRSQNIEGETTLTLPNLRLVDAQKQSGTIVVQADPAYTVRPEELQACETVTLSAALSWLAAKQRDAVRSVIRFTSGDHQGSLRVSQRSPVVTSTSVTNVKVTDRSIEETILIESNIANAGISEFIFRLPAYMRSSRINAPMLRRVSFTPVPDDDASVQVRVELQSEIMGQFRVVIEHDRGLNESTQSAPVLVIETGTTDRRIITLENAGRDELVTSQTVGVERVERSQLPQQFSRDLLASKSSEAYLVLDGENEPLLTYDMKERESITTAGARIGLAQAIVVVDEAGTYRATQEFRVENRTEPFLEIELPEGAEVWTVTVADEPVKPAKSSTTSQTPLERIRVPLVKTAEGDLDYGVVVKYGGQLARPSWLKRIEVPLIRTMNINVELSQVRLRLPESYRWFNFDGTLGQVESDGDLKAGWLAFRTRQLSDLAQLMSVSSATTGYSKVRASSNLKQLEDSLQADARKDSIGQMTQNAELQKQMKANNEALENAKQQAKQLEQQQIVDQPSNRAILNKLYAEQDNTRSLNALDEVGFNFSIAPTMQDAEAEQAQTGFKADWLSQNQLNVPQAAQSQSRLEADAPIEEKTKEVTPLAPSLQRGRRSGVESKSAAGKDPSQEFGRDGDSLQNSVQRYQYRMDQQAAQPGMMDAAQFGEAAGNRPARTGRIMLGGAVGQTDMPASGPGAGMGGGMGSGGMGDSNGFPIVGDFAVALPSDTRASSSNRNAFMASLDVDMPQRGQEFLFATPRGDARLSVQGMSQSAYQRILTIAGLLVAMVLINFLYRLLHAITNRTWGARVLAVSLMIVGVMSLLAGYLPIYGGVAILFAIIVATTRRNDALYSSTRTA